MDLFMNNAVVNELAITFASIIVILTIGGITFGFLLKAVKAPLWLLKPAVTLGILVAMYIAFSIIK